MSIKNISHKLTRLRQKKPDVTKFQWRVFAATLKIPLGQTRTYQWIAGKIGVPGAARAVGQALKRNPYPLIIPCHRVIQSNGTPGGYMGVGVGNGERRPTKKQKLLNIEKEIKNNIPGKK